MTEAGSTPVFERGDVVSGDDPFTNNEKARPWLILSNHEGRPFHGEQYIALTLTTRSWLDGLIETPTQGWLRGGTPDESRIVPWGVQSLDNEDIDHWQGRITSGLVDEAVAALIDEADLYGTHVVKVEPAGPSKGCSVCGVDTAKPIWGREYSCLSCGHEEDRT